MESRKNCKPKNKIKNMDEIVLAQSVSSERGSIADSNNRGNAGRDIINNYGL